MSHNYNLLRSSTPALLKTHKKLAIKKFIEVGWGGGIYAKKKDRKFCGSEKKIVYSRKILKN